MLTSYLLVIFFFFSFCVYPHNLLQMCTAETSNTKSMLLYDLVRPGVLSLVAI